MKLTGKTKEDFELYLKENYNQLIVRTGNDSTFISDLLQAEHIKKTDTLLASVIIEFFDSVGIYIANLPKFSMYESYCNYVRIGYFESRTEATNEAIIKANDLYNGNNK